MWVSYQEIQIVEILMSGLFLAGTIAKCAIKILIYFFFPQWLIVCNELPLPSRTLDRLFWYGNERQLSIISIAHALILLKVWVHIKEISGSLWAIAIIVYAMSSSLTNQHNRLPGECHAMTEYDSDSRSDTTEIIQ